MDAIDTLDLLALDPDHEGRLVHRAVLPAREARYADLAEPLHDEVAARLRARGIDRLYTHQAAAIDLLRTGDSVVLATGTASGKSLCYQVPILESVVAGRRDTALLLFPTKALAHDQLRALRSWLVPGLKAVPYDGDTPPDDRAWARKHANVVLTNPEMLHQGLLPFHGRWATFLMRLRYVVVDELHTLRGIFGSHVAHLLRRLRRVCAHYGSDPTFCFASATIGNPAELASALCGKSVRAIDDDGSPRAERALAVWQRPLVDADLGLRASGHTETARLLARFAADGLPSIAFTRSRRGSELVAARTRAMLAEVPELAARVDSYRGGYLPEERRELERRLASGDLLAVAATNALELGIDIGGLDAVVLDGFPGTLASMWQQIGRAGRAGRRAAAVLVPGDDQLDQWYATHPEELTTRAPEAAVVNPDNPFVLAAQAGCAAHELPLTPDDEKWFGPGLDEAVRTLVLEDALAPRGGRMFWARPAAPAPRVGLRSGTTAEFELLDADRRHPIGTVDSSRVFSVAHPGAIYLHRGRQYRVERLDLDRRVALLTPADDVDEYTQARSDTRIGVLGVDASRPLGAAVVHLGDVEVTTQVIGYQRKRASTREVIETVELDLPPRTLSTRACWYTMPLPALLAAGVEPSDVLSTVHAAEHALIGMLPRFTICDRWDVGGVSMAIHPQTNEPSVFVYDGYDGGAGIAELAYADAADHVAATLELVRACPCDHGCPSCVQSPKCGNLNEYLDKTGARLWLGAVAVAAAPTPPG